MTTHSRSRCQPTPSPVFDTYWALAARRQEIFHKRARGLPPPWTDDAILQEYRFTNAYRAADRVSQYMIRNIAYAGDPNPQEVIFRVLLFKLFNRVSTWELLASELSGARWADFTVERYDSVLDGAFAAGHRLYSAAYITPPASLGTKRKHTTHLQLLHTMMSDRLPEKLAEAKSMSSAFDLLVGYGGIGAFLAYQFVTDLNYTTLLDFTEMEYVKAGPGARSGLEKCFEDPGGYGPEDLIRWTADRQREEFGRRGLEFKDLWGRPLQLIDCQNLYCEIDKYSRVAHPEIASSSQRKRIKQKYKYDSRPLKLWFPPKWGLNERLSASVDKLDSPLLQVNINRSATRLPDAPEDRVARQDRLFPVV